MKGLLGLLLTVLTAAVPTGAFEISSQSRVEFVMKDQRSVITGTTDDVAGAINVRQSGDEFIADVEARINARAITTGISLRDGQMRGERFLNTERFQFITFRGSVSSRDPRPGQFAATLRGRLTIKEVTRDVEVPLQVTALENSYQARGETVVKLSDFGIPLPRFLWLVAEDPVTVRLRINLRSRPGAHGGSPEVAFGGTSEQGTKLPAP